MQYYAIQRRYHCSLLSTWHWLLNLLLLHAGFPILRPAVSNVLYDDSPTTANINRYYLLAICL